MMWDEVEKLHPQTKVWEICTLYFGKMNIHFYVNKCGFHVVTFWNKRNQDPNKTEYYMSNEFDGMFVFQKVI